VENVVLHCKLPLGFKTFLSLHDVESLVFANYPTNNSLVNVLDLKVLDTQGLEGYNAFGNRFCKLINENQGCCYWYVMWHEDAHGNVWPMDPPVYVNDDDIHLPTNYERYPPWQHLQLCNYSLDTFLNAYFTEGVQWYATEWHGFSEHVGQDAASRLRP
jgi:hypothetical protein